MEIQFKNIFVFEDFGFPPVDTMPAKFAGVDAEFAWRGHLVAATTTSISSEMAEAASNKGWELVALLELPESGIPEQLIKLLKG